MSDPPYGSPRQWAPADLAATAGRWRRGIAKTIVIACLAFRVAAAEETGQWMIPAVESMPRMPSPYRLRDWRQTAIQLDAFVYDEAATGEHLPLVWLERGEPGKKPTRSGLPAYVGDPRSLRAETRACEAIACLGGILGSTVAGLDKATGRRNWVRMAMHHFDDSPDQRIVLNTGKSGQSFWYDIFPNMLFLAIADRYPDERQLEPMMLEVMSRWHEACLALENEAGIVDFCHTAFDFAAMAAVDNGRWQEPDAAAGVAWLLYMAHVRTGERRFLESARQCLDFLERREQNPTYELLTPFGAYTAARFNAERGGRFDVCKLVAWSFERSAVRPDWAAVQGRWADHDVAGLLGASNREPGRPAGGGYAFAMNTFCAAWPLVPSVRYEPRLARTVGRWMVNAANAARLFYADSHPPERQSSAGWRGDPGRVLVYEGLKHRWDGSEELFAAGDPVALRWGPTTDFAVYASVYSGIFGGIIRPTNIEMILRLDLLATDFFREPAYPTWLLYNPHREAQKVRVDIGDGPVNLYDAVRGIFVGREATGETTIVIPPDEAVVLVAVPAGARTSLEGNRLMANGVVVDFWPLRHRCD